MSLLTALQSNTPFANAAEIPEDSLRTPRIICYNDSKGKSKASIRKMCQDPEEGEPFLCLGSVEDPNDFKRLGMSVRGILVPSMMFYFFGKRGIDHSLVSANLNDDAGRTLDNQYLAVVILDVNGEPTPTLSTFERAKTKGFRDALKALDRASESGNQKIPAGYRFLSSVQFGTKASKGGKTIYHTSSFNCLVETPAAFAAKISKPSAAFVESLESIGRDYEAEVAKIKELAAKK